MHKYYIIYGVPRLANGYYDVAYNGIKDCPNTTYVNSIKPVDNIPSVTWAHKVWFSYQINKFIDLPCKRCFFKTFVPKELKPIDNICFVFFSRWFADAIYVDFAKYLKNKYANAKFVCYYHDTIASHGNVDNEWVKKFFDLVLSYDKDDAKEYGLTYYPTPYTRIDINEDEAYKSDVYYLGSAKKRLPKILDIYTKLKAQNLKLNFRIAGEVDEDIKQQFPDIVFTTNGISYKENLKYVYNSNCIVEIMQDGASGITPRTWESIAYNKILLTDNLFLPTSEFWDEKRMTLDVNKVSNMLSDIPTSYNTKVIERIHPQNLIRFIGDIFSQQKQIN